MFNIPIHFLFIHFPIALTVIATIYDVRAYIGKRPELHRTGYAMIMWAAAGAALAMLTGLQLLGDRHIASRATLHAAFGLISGLSLIVLAMVRYSAQARVSEPSESSKDLWLVLEVCIALVVVATMLTGHMLALEVLGA